MAVTDAAIVRIKDMITSGRLGPGDRLPREADLALQLGLSRNSLREAVKALSLVKVLDVRQGDGTYVTSLSPELLLDGLSFVVDVQQDDTVLHFLGVRRILEPAAAGLAAGLRRNADVAEMRQLLERSDPSDPDTLLDIDLGFHRLVGSACGNAVLASLIESLSGPTNRARLWRGLTETGAQERTIAEHWQIYRAIADGAADMAAAAMLLHVSGVERWVREVHDRPDPPPQAGPPHRADLTHQADPGRPPSPSEAHPRFRDDDQR